MAAATAVHLAESGRRTLVISVDPAHSLSDSFDVGGALFDSKTAEPLKLAENLFIQEVNVNYEFKRYWNAISTYISSVLRTTGLQGVEAEEMAIFPGMEELSAMMYVNQYRKSGEFDVIVLDCAPTAESLRFVSLPTTLDWYMKHIFGFQRSMLKAVRPLANRLAPVELPPDSYFRNVQDLFEKIEGIDLLLEDPDITSVRLVTNPEKMVLRETQRAFVYLSLHGLVVDRIMTNRVIPQTVHDAFFDSWRLSQSKTLEEIYQYFAPVPVYQVPLFPHEILGYARLRDFSLMLYGAGEDAAAVTRKNPPFSFTREEKHYEVRLELPFVANAEVGLFKKNDELIIEVGTVRRHVGLPTSMAALQPARARLDGRKLIVEMKDPA